MPKAGLCTGTGRTSASAPCSNRGVQDQTRTAPAVCSALHVNHLDRGLGVELVRPALQIPVEVVTHFTARA